VKALEAAFLRGKVLDGQAVTREEALVLYERSTLTELGVLAEALKSRSKGDDIVTFLIDRNINFTNVCVTRCKFCAFHRPPGDPEAYIEDVDAIVDKVGEAVRQGATQVLLQGGHHPDLSIDWYLSMLFAVKSAHPGVTLHAFSPPEIIHLSGLFGMEPPEVLRRFREAGMDSMPGGGAEILVDRVRDRVAPAKACSEEWLYVMQTAHEMGMRTTATMMFGHVETPADRIEHVFRVKELQDETGGFLGFIPWLYQPGNEALGARPARGQEYLKTLALCRIILDRSIPNLQASWLTPGKEIGQLGLRFGANDFGSVMLEENVVAATGRRHDMTLEEMKALIREAGFEPRQRDTFYNLVD
jgi:cyclic dehypoxanthinyl futalosine synthase